MNKIVPYDSLDLLNSELKPYHLQVNPDDDQYRVLTIKLLIPGISTTIHFHAIAKSYTPFVKAFNQFTDKYLGLDKKLSEHLSYKIIEAMGDYHVYHYVIPIALINNQHTVVFWSHKEAKSSDNHKYPKITIQQSNNLANWYEQEQNWFDAYEIEYLVNSQPYYLKLGLIGAIKCTDYLESLEF